MTFAAVAALAAGCTGPAHDTVPFVLSAAGPTGGALGVNLTRCSEVESYVELPEGSLGGRIPPGFEVQEDQPGIGRVVLQTNACGKVSVDGIDRGPATWSVVGIRVRQPAPVDPTLTLSCFVALEAWSEHPDLVGWFHARSAFPVENATTENARQEIPASRQVVQSRITSGGATLYDVRGAVSTYSVSEISHARWYLPTANGTFTLDVRETARVWPDHGPAAVRPAPGTVLSDIAQGSSLLPGFVAPREAASIVLSALEG